MAPCPVIAMLLLVLNLSFACGKFTVAAAFGNDCVQRAHNGALCFYPGPTSDTYIPRFAACAHENVTLVLHGHLFPDGASVAYYDLETRVMLGDTETSMSKRESGTTVVCHTGVYGHVEDGWFLTTCRITHGDDDFGLVAAHDGECQLVHPYGERVINDGCAGENATKWMPTGKATVHGHN